MLAFRGIILLRFLLYAKRTGGFRSRIERADHFTKHRKRLRIPGGFVYEIIYERMADRFLGNPLDMNCEEFTRLRNGDKVRYDKKSDVFGIKDHAIRIKTYFCPNPAVHLQGTNHAYYLFEKGRA
jgi:hypothetical protein